MKFIIEVVDVGAETIGDLWTSFSKTTLDAIDAGEVQRTETRRAFYAGARAMFSLVNVAAELPEEEACKKMDGFVAEFEQFRKDVREGRA